MGTISFISKEKAMTSNYNSKTMKLVEVLNDLAWIHNDRINEYQQTLILLKSIDTDVRDEFERIIANGKCFKLQLLQEVNGLIGEANMYSALPIFGKIYKVWMDLKTKFSGNTQKSIISSCKYNEEIAINVYRAAINTNVEMPKETKQLIEQHEGELRKEHERIRKYHIAPHTIDYRTLYYS